MYAYYIYILYYIYYIIYTYMYICKQKDPCSGYDLYWLTAKGS